MATVTVSEDIKAKAADVWAALSDFGGIKVGGPMTSFETQGKGVGMVRTIGMGGGRVVERLDRHDPKAMVFAYSITNEDCPLPVTGLCAHGEDHRQRQRHVQRELVGNVRAEGRRGRGVEGG